MQRVIDEAQRVGARLAFAGLPTPLRGLYLADQDLTLISDSLDDVQAAETGAHELGHRYYGDRCSSHGAESRAWVYAAKVLIDIDSYRLAELEDPHPLSIAHNLNTTLRMVQLYQQHHLQQQALAAPRTIFGELSEEDYFEDSFRHSLKAERHLNCGFKAIS